jgi:hypothetical protein
LASFAYLILEALIHPLERIAMKRIFSGVLAMIAALAVGLIPASGAQANGAGYNCADVGQTSARVCLYNYINTVASPGGYWQRSWDDVIKVCVNLSQHSWHNDSSSQVHDEASSMIVTAGNMANGEYFKVRAYDHVNCSSANGYFDTTVFSNGVVRYPNLNDVGSGWANRIGSVQFFFYAT